MRFEDVFFFFFLVFSDAVGLRGWRAWEVQINRKIKWKRMGLLYRNWPWGSSLIAVYYHWWFIDSLSPYFSFIMLLFLMWLYFMIFYVFILEANLTFQKLLSTNILKIRKCDIYIYISVSFMLSVILLVVRNGEG